MCKKRRLLAWALTIVLIGTVFPFAAAAEEPAEETPTEISEGIVTPSPNETPPEEMPTEEGPPEELPPNAEEPAYFVTVEWTVEPATIDIDRVCEYVWNTETLRYVLGDARLEIGERNTVNVEVTITSFSTVPVSYEIRYTDNPSDELTTEADTDSGTIEAPEDTELGQTVTFNGTVTVTGIAADAQITADCGALGTYTVTVCAVP